MTFNYICCDFNGPARRPPTSGIVPDTFPGPKPINYYSFMKVFKFGGASVQNIDRIQLVADILKSYPNEKILIVISAMGKTTNALEKVTEAFFNNHKEEALLLFEAVKQQATLPRPNTCW